MVQKDLPDDKVLEVEPVIESTGLIRISDYPEQFGKLSDLFSAINSFKASRQIRLIPWLILAVLTFMATPIIFRFYIEFNGEATGRAWLDAAKIIFIYIAFVVGSILLLTGIFYKRIKKDLEDFEELAFLGRDFARFNLPYYRHEIKQLNERLAGTSKESILTGLDIIRDLVPVVRLLLAKESSLLKWGLSGLKAVNTVKSFFGGK